MQFTGRVALVTAAAGAGIGQATARALAAEGATVVVTDRHAERTHAAAEDISSDTAGRAVGMPLDVTDEAAVIDVVGRTVDEFGQLDILVNNSGTNELSPVWEMSTDSWRKVMEVSLTAHFWLLRAALAHMTQRGAGAAVNITSVAGWMGTDEGEAHYAAAKAGVMGLTRSAAVEAAKHGVRVNAVAPGLAWNEFLAKVYPPEFFDDLVARTPLGRVGTPEDIADAVVFLASDRASFITGETLCVAGGMYLHP